MAREVRLSIPHELGAEEATRRIREGLEKLRAEYGAHLSSADVAWNEQHADLQLGAFGQMVTGTIDVAPGTVEITFVLPALLASFAERAKGFLERKGTDILRLPPGAKS